MGLAGPAYSPGASLNPRGFRNNDSHKFRSFGLNLGQGGRPFAHPRVRRTASNFTESLPELHSESFIETMAARGMYILGRKCTERLPTPPTEPPHGMDDWFQIHSFIMSYLNAFQYAIATEGDGGLKEQYTRYVTRCAHSLGAIKLALLTCFYGTV